MLSEIITNEMILQILQDGSISASWLFGGIISALCVLIWYNLTQFRNDVKTVLKQHGEDIQEIKLHKADVSEVRSIRENNQKTMHELDKSIHELNITMTTIGTKLAILHGED